MRHIRSGLCVILLLALGLAGLQAQNMYVKERAGTQAVYPLSDISKLSFSSGNLTITKGNRSSNAYALNDLRYLSFRDISISVKKAEPRETPVVGAYHRRVGNMLNIHLTGAGVQDRTIEILNLQGRVLKKHRFGNTDLVSIDVSKLGQGIYIYRYAIDTEVNAVKFIKN
jgi:hypothetical protein